MASGGRRGNMKRPSSVISLDDECEREREVHQSASTTASISRQISQLFNEPSFRSSQSIFSVTTTGAGGGSSNELRKAKHELNVSKIEMQKLTVQIGELQRKLEASTANFEKENKKWQDERILLVNTVKEGKSKLKEVEDKLKESEDGKAKIKSALSRELSEAEERLAETQERLTEAENKCLQLQLEASNYSQGMESVNESLQGEIEEKNQKIEELMREVERLNVEIDQLKLTRILDSRQATVGESGPLDSRVMAMMSEQSRLEQQIRKLQSENTRLKEATRDAMLLREKLHDSAVQLRRMRELEDRLAELESGQQVEAKLMESPMKVLGAPPAVMRELMEKSVEITRLTEEASKQRSKMSLKESELIELKTELANVHRSLALEKQQRLEMETRLAEAAEKSRLQTIEVEALKAANAAE